MNGYFKIGVVAATHGIKGELRVFPTTDEPNRYYDLSELILILDNKQLIYKIERLYLRNKFVITKLKGINSINDAQKLKGAKIIIPDELAIPLYKDEYFIRDLHGLKVYNEESLYLGELIDVITTGANDVYVVNDLDDDLKKSLLIPAIKQCILNVDIKNRKMIVKLLEEELD